MISECLEGINEPTDINKFYYQESPNKMPPLLIYKDRFEKQNTDISKNITDSSNNKPIYVRNQSNAGDLQRGYSENIDVESELKYINRFNDQCFYDNYKMDFKTNKGLSKHYDKIFKPQEQKINKMKDKKISGKKFIDENCVNWKNVKNFEECDVKKALPCPNINSSNLFLNSQNVFYQFHNDKYLDFYSCESLFNNFTKRN